MRNYFQAGVRYQEEGADKETNKAFLVESINFTEAETSMTKYMTDFEDITAFDIHSLSKISFDDLLFSKGVEEIMWHEVRVKIKYDGGDKWNKYILLVADKDVKSVTRLVLEHLKDTQGEYRITSIKEKDYADVVFVKHCDIMGDLVVSFQDQREIDLQPDRLEEIRVHNERIRQELGAIALYHNKYKIEVDKLVLKKLMGERIARRVLRLWNEAFVDEDNGEVVNIERNEVIFERGTELTPDVVKIILESEVKELFIYR